MSLDKLFEGIPWHQRWEIEPGVFTPGHNPVADLLQYASAPADMSGKRVLDIGAWNGCFSFECERRGAAEVLAIGPETADATGFTKLKAHLGSQVTYRQGSIYDLTAGVYGHFDIIICFGVIYHLRHPLLGMDMMRRICSGKLYLETAGIDENLVLSYGESSGLTGAKLVNRDVEQGRTFESTTLAQVDRRLERLSLLQFYRLEELNRDSTNWFAMNQRCCEDLLLSAGFMPVNVRRFGHRIAVEANVIPGDPEWMSNSGEGVYYDVITAPLFGARTRYN